MLDQTTYEKSRVYALDKSNFGAVQGVFSQVVSSLIMWYMGYKVVWDWAGTKASRIYKVIRRSFGLGWKFWARLLCDTAFVTLFGDLKRQIWRGNAFKMVEV